MVKTKRKVSSKMTIREDADEEGDTGLQVEAMEVDSQLKESVVFEKDMTSSSTDLLHLLDGFSSSKGLKLIRYVIEDSKKVCKLLTSTTSCESEDKNRKLLLSNQIYEKISKTCDKHKKGDQEKLLKFFNKTFGDVISCDGDFFKTLLKYGMNNGENAEGGPRIVGILQSIFSVGAAGGRVENATVGIQMIVSHSKATDIFLESHQFQNVSKNKIKSENHVREKESNDETLEKPSEKFSEIKTQLLKLWKTLVIAFTQVSKRNGTPNDKKILENSIPYLFQMYSGTMSESDQEIFEILQEYSGKRLKIDIENLPLFGPKSLEPVNNTKVANPLFAHSSRANSVLGLVKERQAFETAMQYKETDADGINSKHYDFRFLLPLICNVLDAKNICDAVKVISNGWIYLIVRGMSFEDSRLRNMAFLAYKLLIQNFQLPKKGHKTQDIKVWLHFLLSVRKGVESLGRCKLSNLLSTWMVSVWESIREPAHPLYPRLTNLLLAKPTVDLSVVPDFMPFYNATDGNKTTREWMLNILSKGLQTREDWQVAQRLPTINSLCCSFLIEDVFTQRIILGILREGARIPEMAQEMVDKHSLLIWISNVPFNSKNLYRRELQNLFETLRENCVQNESRQFMFRFVEKSHGWSINETES